MVLSMKVSTRTKVFIALCILAVFAAAEKYVEETSSIDNNSPVSGAYQKSHYYNPLPDDLEQDPHHPNKHKDLFPFDSADMWGTVLVTLGLLVAASGGIGGGGILVPLFILIFEFKPKYAIPLSNFCILGSSITNMALNLTKRHPYVNRPLVDWDLILVMEPLTMAGAVTGAFMSKVLPDYILVISLVILLAFTTWTTLDKGISQWKKETKTFAEAKKSEVRKAMDAQVADEETQSLLPTNNDNHSNNNKVSSKETSKETSKQSIDLTKVHTPSEEDTPMTIQQVNVADTHAADTLTHILAEESTTPWRKVWLVSALVAVVLLLNLMKGGSSGGFASPLGITCGSTAYWVVTVAVYGWVLFFAVWMRSDLIQQWTVKKRIGYQYMEGDIEWNPMNTIKFPCICFFAGLFAGLFGIGGGIVKGPLMLMMGIHPLVASATTAVMIMFTSVAATTMFIAFGTLTWDYAWFFFVLGLAATVVGQFGVSYLVQQSGRMSLVSLSIGAVVALSTVLMAIQAIFSLVDPSNDTEASSTLCGK